MKAIPYRCDDSRHKALLGAARSTGTSVQRLFDNFVTHVITERQAEARFVARQRRGNPARGRELLAEIRRRIAAGAKITVSTRSPASMSPAANAPATNPRIRRI